MFIGREKELAQLEKAYSEDGFKFFVVQGGKGSGKTPLLEEFCRNKAAIFFTAKDASSRANLSDFSQKILRHYGENEYAPFQFWDSALRHIADIQMGNRVILVIDGFDILAERDSAFLGIFENVLKYSFKRSNIFLAVTSDKAAFLKEAYFARLITGNINLGKFLTEANIALMVKLERKESEGMKQSKFFRAQADKVILKEGSRSDYVYKIVSGRAVCYINYGTDDEYLLGSIKEGSTFGEYSLLTGKPSIYTVVAFTDMLLMRIERGEFSKFIGLNAGNAVTIMKNMADMMNVMKVNIDMMNEELHHRD